MDLSIPSLKSLNTFIIAILKLLLSQGLLVGLLDPSEDITVDGIFMMAFRHLG